jgi:thioredoxin-dependent peroxiredoxin
VNYPMIGDPELKLQRFETCSRPMRELHLTVAARRTNPTVRTVFVIGSDKRIKLMLSYPMSTGRNFDEFCECWIRFSSRPLTRF